MLRMIVRSYGYSWVIGGGQDPGHTTTCLHSRKTVGALGRAPSRPRILRLLGPPAPQMACVAHRSSMHRHQNLPLLVAPCSHRACHFYW
jgi:hypothetical protein